VGLGPRPQEAASLRVILGDNPDMPAIHILSVVHEGTAEVATSPTSRLYQLVTYACGVLAWTRIPA